MSYRLVVDQKIRNTKNNRYINIDFFDKGIYSLEEINNFTTQFNDEYDFKEYLLDNKIINIGMIDLPIKIIDAKNNRISFEPFYLDNENLLDINNIITYFQNHIDNNILLGRLYYSFGKRTDKYTNSEVVHRELGYYYSCIKNNYYYDPYDNRNILNIIDEYIRKLCKNNFINIQKIASMIIQNENKDIKHNNSDTKRLEHLRILLKNNDFSEEKEAEMLNKEYEMLLEKLNLGEQRKW